jgi:hypothetical protein
MVADWPCVLRYGTRSAPWASCSRAELVCDARAVRVSVAALVHMVGSPVEMGHSQVLNSLYVAVVHTSAACAEAGGGTWVDLGPTS